MRISLTGSLVAIALFSGTPASSQDARDKAMAESLFQDALKLFDGDRAAEACPLLEQSYRLDPKLSTKINVALCHEKIGRTASAWIGFTEAASLAEKAKDTKRAEFAREHERTLSGKLSKIKVARPIAPNELTLSLDKKPFDGAMFNVALPVDPGRHLVEVSAPGHQTFSTEVDVPMGPVEVPIQVPALTKTSPPEVPPQVVPPKPRADPKPEPVPPTKESGGVHPVAIAAFTIGGAGLVTGIITGAASWSMAGKLEETCSGGCRTEEDRSDLDTATSLANASNATFAIAGLGALMGTIFLFVSTEDDPKAARIEPISTGDIGLGLRARF